LYLTVQTYVSDGQQIDFTVPMSYIKREYIKTYQQAPNAAGFYIDDPVPIPSTWINSNLVRLDSAPPSGYRVIIRRETYADEPLVDFQDAAILIEADLDLASLQALHVAQEARDDNGRNLEAAIEYFRSIQSRMEEILVEGEALRGRIEEYFQTVLTLAKETESFREAAEASAGASEDARDDAVKAYLDAKEAEYWARLWASQSPGVEVKDGLYSARHYADKARANSGDLGDHIDAVDPHPQYAQKSALDDYATKLILDDYAKLNSPAFSGEPTVPTADAGDASEQAANTLFVQTAVESRAVVTWGTVDLTPGNTPLATGAVHLVYEI